MNIEKSFDFRSGNFYRHRAKLKNEKDGLIFPFPGLPGRTPYKPGQPSGSLREIKL